MATHFGCLCARVSAVQLRCVIGVHCDNDMSEPPCVCTRLGICDGDKWMAGTQVLAPDSNARPLEAVLGRDNVFTCDECVR